ncbi:MAG: Lrp/AsnC family transcriptional regulator [Erysipelotrichaceae bacterium]|jgi:DNA-binding Lrp family transcriptional regulator|nr:Lrp/AsnC family transcriptional regulator [Erysipelotrichaceae bacterium]
MNELLKLLENNARYQVKDLAALLNEDEDAVTEKIDELEKENIIAGYHTIINWEKADVEISKALIFVNCVPERVAGYDKLARRISKYPEVESLSLISGKAEFLLSVNGRNMREISNFVAHKLAPTDGVNGTETMFVLKEYKKNGISFEDDREDGERLLVTP